jgi:hypothetical protein
MSDNNNAAIGFKEAGEEGEADYKELVLHLKHDAELTYRCIKEIAQARELSQNPHLHKAFERLLADSKKSIQRLDSELKQLESSSRVIVIAVKEEEEKNRQPQLAKQCA